MFSGIYVDKENSKLLIAERKKDGSRNIEKVPLLLEYYVPDPHGKYVGTDDVVLRRMVLKNLRTYYTAKKEENKKKQEDPNYRTYGLDAKPAHQTLYKFYRENYGECPNPVLHKSFFDIEVDLENEKGISINELVEKGHKPINAISIYNDWEERLYTAALYPPTLEKREADAIIANYPDAKLFTNEKELIKQFIEWFSDADIEIGWNNCLPLGSTVWLKDRIKPIERLTDGEELLDSTVVKVSGIHEKPEYKISMANGAVIYVSKDHIFPFVSDGEIQGDHTVEEIQQLLDKEQVFFNVCLHNNTNPDLTYRELLQNSLPNLFLSYRMNNLATYVKEQLETNLTLKLPLHNGESVEIELDEVIPESVLNALGTLFVNDDHNNLPLLSNALFGTLPDAETTVHTDVDDDTLKFDLVGTMLLYKNLNKEINVEVFSMLSKKQFRAFIEGCIEGGQSVLTDKHVGFAVRQNDALSFGELLRWNGVSVYTGDFATYTEAHNFVDNRKPNTVDVWFNAGDFTETHEGGDEAYVRVTKIEPTGRTVKMMDICTNTHYFWTQGFYTHNCKFDLPYIVQRIKTLFADEGEDAVSEVLKSLTPFHVEPIGSTKKTEFGDEYTEYELAGIWSADMMEVYKKHTPHEHESYKLDNIADEELGERKVAYDGTLDDLFRDDFKTFIDYNRQDTMLVYKLDKKTNYLNIHNMQAHELMVPLDVTMGTVGWFSQAVTNFARDQGKILPDKWEARQAQWEGIKAPGAFVQDPVPGIHEWISDMDMTSLYPSVIRCLNMSPETIIGQMRLDYTLPYLKKKIVDNGLWEKMMKRIPNWAKAWGGDELFGTFEYQLIMAKADQPITCDYEDGRVFTMTGAQWYDFIFNQDNQISLSAFGTLYRTDKQGIVPALLTKWFGERKAYKKEMKRYEDMLAGVIIEDENDVKALQAEIAALERETENA